MLYVDGWDGMDECMGWDRWMDGMVIIGHRSSKSTLGAHNYSITLGVVWKMIGMYQKLAGEHKEYQPSTDLTTIQIYFSCKSCLTKAC